MKIVEFNNGKFGIRKSFIFSSFIDLKCPSITWVKREYHFIDCQGPLEQCINVYNQLNIKVKRIVKL
jgi:hypothetical protein